MTGPVKTNLLTKIISYFNPPKQEGDGLKATAPRIEAPPPVAPGVNPNDTIDSRVTEEEKRTFLNWLGDLVKKVFIPSYALKKEIERDGNFSKRRDLTDEEIKKLLSNVDNPYLITKDNEGKYHVYYLNPSGPVEGKIFEVTKKGLIINHQESYRNLQELKSACGLGEAILEKPTGQDTENVEIEKKTYSKFAQASNTGQGKVCTYEIKVEDRQLPRFELTDFNSKKKYVYAKEGDGFRIVEGEKDKINKYYRDEQAIFEDCLIDPREKIKDEIKKIKEEIEHLPAFREWSTERARDELERIYVAGEKLYVLTKWEKEEDPLKYCITVTNPNNPNKPVSYALLPITADGKIQHQGITYATVADFINKKFPNHKPLE